MDKSSIGDTEVLGVELRGSLSVGCEIEESMKIHHLRKWVLKQMDLLSQSLYNGP